MATIEQIRGEVEQTFGPYFNKLSQELNLDLDDRKRDMALILAVSANLPAEEIQTAFKVRSLPRLMREFSLATDSVKSDTKLMDLLVISANHLGIASESLDIS